MQTLDKDIWRIAWPAIVTNITVPLLGLVDVAIVGHIGNATYIGAIAIATMVFNVIYWLFAFLRMGTSGLTAQAFGSGDMLRCTQLLRNGVMMAAVLSVVLLVSSPVLRTVLYHLIGVSEGMLPLVDQYYNIGIWGMPAMLSVYALSGWFIGMQDTKVTMRVSISQNIINIVLSPVFVFGLGMGIAGVALGTVLSQWSGLTIALVLQRSIRKRLAVIDRGQHATSSPPSLHLKTYADIFLRTMFLVAVNMYFVSFGASMGEHILAVNTLLMQLFMLYSYITDGFAYAGEALTGKHLGAGNVQQLRRTVRRLFLWGTVAMIVFAIAYICGAIPFLRLLTDDESVLQLSREYLPWIVAVPIAGMAAFVWDGVFIGATLTRQMLVATMAAAVVFFAVWYLSAHIWGNHALWMAFIAFLAVRGAVQTVCYKIYCRDKM